MFTESFEKVSMLAGAAIGGLFGGEDDGKGGKKNRIIGAVRGAAAEKGLVLGSHAPMAFKNRSKIMGKLVNKSRKHIGALELAFGVAGAVGAHKAMKYALPYDKEKK